MKMFGLIYNEIIKIVKKTSFKICVILMFLFTILISVLFDWAFDSGTTYLYSDIDLEVVQEEIIDKPSSDTEFLINDINNFKVSVIEDSIAKGEEYSSFKLNLCDEYINKKIELLTIDYLLKGKKIDFSLIDDYFYSDVSSFGSLDKNELVDFYENLDKEVSILSRVIQENDYKWYLNREIELLKNGELGEIELLRIKTYEKLISLNVTNPNDKRILIAEDIVDLYSQKEETIDEAEYLKSNFSTDYDVYVKINEAKNKSIDEEIEISWYALENNINTSLDSKSFFKDSITNSFIFISLIVVIVAGGIISNEFQKGTIRLLLIRPNKRYKVLLSKILSILIIAFVLGVISYILSFILNGILFGFKAYFVPDLVYTSSGVVEKSFIFNSLSYIFILMVPIIFITIFSVFLSVLINSTSFSVGFSIFLLIGYQLIMLLLSSLGISFLDYTFLPYMDFSQFLSSAYLDNCFMYGIYFNLFKACLVIILWSFVFYFIANLVFVKKDIKN